MACNARPQKIPTKLGQSNTQVPLYMYCLQYGYLTSFNPFVGLVGSSCFTSALCTLSV